MALVKEAILVDQQAAASATFGPCETDHGASSYAVAVTANVGYIDERGVPHATTPYLVNAQFDSATAKCGREVCCRVARSQPRILSKPRPASP